MHEIQLLSRRRWVQQVCKGAAGLAVVRFGSGCTPGPAPGSNASDGSNGDSSSTSRPIFDACFASGEKVDRVRRDFDNGTALGVSSTPTFFVNGEELRLTQLPTTADFSAALAANPPDGASDPLLDVADDDHVKGDPNAPDTIIEYGDLQCPFCGDFFRTTYSSLITTLVDTGRARFVFRHFPLTQIHPNALPAAVAAECADDQGMFFEYHDLLFANQDNLETEDLQRYADMLGLA